MDSFVTLGSILGLSFAAGINLYATVALVGLSVRYQWVAGLPAELHIFGNEVIIGVALGLYVVEFFADKIPIFDSIWDLLHSFIRPFSGAAIALIAAGDADPVFKVIAVIIGTAVATTSHFSKTGTRLLANTSPEPFSNVALSLAEDIGALSIGYLALAHPYISALIVFFLLTLVFIFGPQLYRIARFWISALIARFSSLFNHFDSSDPLPEKIWHHLNLQSPPPLVSECFIRQCPGMTKNSKGYVIAQNDGLTLVTNRWFKIKSVFLPLIEISKVHFTAGFFYIFFEIYNEKEPVYLVFTKNRLPLVKELKESSSVLLD